MLHRRLPIHSTWRKPPTLTKTMVQRTPHCQEIRASHGALCNSASEGILLFSHRLCPFTYRSPITLQYVGYTRLSSSELVDLDLIASRGSGSCHSLYVSGNSLTELALEWAKKANREAYRYECVRRYWPCMREEFALRVVTPAEAGVQGTQRRWIPAFAGMTETGVLYILARESNCEVCQRISQHLQE